jgi:hypothetical protein
VFFNSIDKCICSILGINASRSSNASKFKSIPLTRTIAFLILMLIFPLQVCKDIGEHAMHRQRVFQGSALNPAPLLASVAFFFRTALPGGT